MASIVASLGGALSGAAGSVASAAAASPWGAAQVGLLGAGTGLGVMGQISEARQADIEGARQRDILARETSRTIGEQVSTYGAAGVDPNVGSPMQIAESTYAAQQRMNEDLVRATEMARRNALLRAIGISAFGVGSMVGPIREIIQQQGVAQAELGDLSLFATPQQQPVSLMGQGELLLPGGLTQPSISNIPPPWGRINGPSNRYSLLGSIL